MMFGVGKVINLFSTERCVPFFLTQRTLSYATLPAGRQGLRPNPIFEPLCETCVLCV